MSEKNNVPIEQSNSEMMEKLRQISADDLTIEDDFSAVDDNDIAAMSDDDIRERLRSQFISDSKKEDRPSRIEQTYSYDESFLLEAVPEDESEEASDTAPETVECEEPEDEDGSFETDNAVIDDEYAEDDGLTFDDLAESEDENDAETFAIELDEADESEDADDGLTFDDIVETEDENDVATFAIELDEAEEDEDTDDGLTFDDIVETEDENDVATFVIELDAIADGSIGPEEITAAEDDINMMSLDAELLGEPLPPPADEYGGDETVTRLEEPEENDRISIYSLYNREEPENKAEEASAATDNDEYLEDTCETVEENYETLEEDIDEADEYGEDIFDISSTCENELLTISAPTEESSEFTEAIEKAVEDTVGEAEENAERQFLDGMLDLDEDGEAFEENTAFDKLVQNNPDGAEIALLLQLGCEDEIIGRYDKASLDKLSEEEALKQFSDEDEDVILGTETDGEDNTEDGYTESEEKREDDDRLAKINGRYETYAQKRGALFVKLVINALIAVALLIYEGLPALGIELGGILDREEYTVVPYVLIALSLVILACFTSYRKLWEGLKALISPLPNAYSMVALLGIVTLIYDISIMPVRDDIPPTFHLPVVLLLVLAIVRDCQLLGAEKNCFEFFFEDELFEGTESTAKFTLVKNDGRGSVAEKMYAGGLDPSKNVYAPIEINSGIGFFRAVQTKSKRADVPMVLLIPSMAFSVAVGIFALLVSEAVWVSLGGTLISLALTLPIVATVSSWLPFERLSAAADINGYAFASEGCLEESDDCDMMIFNDLHMFAPCQPSNVNLALYDATDKAVLLGCLSAVYGEIGGPLGETFAAARDQRLEKCRLTRVAKIGVEAIVGTNYSVLIGSEAFMSRYGISFPSAVLKNKEDGVFTVCISINGRATARMAVRYTVNEMFEMFVARLAQDGIECVIRTFDPMINADLLKRARRADVERVSIVHMSAEDYATQKNGDKDTLLFDAAESELTVSARSSRFNLAVAMSAAKRMKKLRKYCNWFAFGMAGVGALIALAAAAFDLISGFNSVILLLYWAVWAAGLVFMIIKLIPTKSRFSFERFKQELEASDDQ